MGVSMGIYQLFPFVLICILPVSIVVDSLGSAEGIRRGIDFILSNKVEALLILLLYLFATILGFEAIMWVASPNINLAIIIPLSFFEIVVLYPPFLVLWTRLYMDRTGKLDGVGSEAASQMTPTDQKKDQSEIQRQVRSKIRKRLNLAGSLRIICTKI